MESIDSIECAECEVWSVECKVKVWSVKRKVYSVECGVGSGMWGLWSVVECGV